MQGSETRDSRAHTTRWRQHLNPTRLMDSIRDGRRDTEHGARSTFKHSASNRGSGSLAHTYPHEARQKTPRPTHANTITRTGRNGKPAARVHIRRRTQSATRAPGGQPERISPRPSGCLSTRMDSESSQGPRITTGTVTGACVWPRALPVAKQALSGYPKQTRVQQGYTAGVTVQSKSPGFPPVQCASRHLFTHTHTHIHTYIHCDRNYVRFTEKKTINPPVHIISKSSMHWQRKVAEGHSQSESVLKSNCPTRKLPYTTLDSNTGLQTASLAVSAVGPVFGCRQWHCLSSSERYLRTSYDDSYRWIQ